MCFITPELRAIINTICFMAVYGHNSLFEARDNEDEFYASLKRHGCRAANSCNGAGGGADTDESESEKIMMLLDGGSDVDAEAGPAAGGSG